ncbi:quinate permease [Hortaea werneckii]|nr:quinate permease [Hortaea werneckii]KAI6985727.1 quinate permease [Hortaea werneckii]KAI7140444.1 quinate permease [Hortaea werneckii]KAI7167097.1 quinate permease [Hortaea werneckii]
MGLWKQRRVVLLTATAYMGALLFGFDTGVMGSVLAMEGFKTDFGLPIGSTGFADEKNAQVSSNVVSLLTAGAFFGAIFGAFVNERIGRRFTMMLFALVFLVGAAMQTGSPGIIGLIYAGRVIAGLGIGGMSAVMSVYVSENAPAKYRGGIAGLFQEFLVLGSTFAYWLDYGVNLHIPTSTRQWRIPVSIQLIPGGLMLIGLFFLKESPRWLTKKDRHEEAVAALSYVRAAPVDSDEVVHEIGEIRASCEEEKRASAGMTWRECLKPGARKRFILAFVLMVCQQFSGTNSIGYYAPQIFQTVGLSAADSSLFATGIYGTVKVVATGIFLIVGIDRFGRKKSLVFGAAWMMSMMFIIGAVLTTHPPENTDGVSQASIAMVAMIYLYVIGYSASWGPTPWVFVSEIFPTRLRGYGVGLAAATQWLFNFIITKITPEAVNNIGWKTFIMFGVFCFSNGVFVFLFIPETKQMTLEEIDMLFGGPPPEERQKDVERAMSDAQHKTHEIEFNEHGQKPEGVEHETPTKHHYKIYLIVSKVSSLQLIEAVLPNRLISAVSAKQTIPSCQDLGSKADPDEAFQAQKYKGTQSTKISISVEAMPGETPERKLRLLSLDGGGVRGLASLYMLKQLLSQFGDEKPCDFFDMIAGTSTGGLIAIMLACLEMSIDDCIDAFTSLMGRAFKKEHKLAFTFCGKVQHRYDSKELEKAIKEVITGTGLHQDALLRHNPTPKCKCFVVALSEQASTITHFTNYKKDHEMSNFYDKVKIWEAARATSAATSFFDPITIDGSAYVDGGLGMNNPVDRLWREAREVFVTGEQNLEDLIRCVLSVGTGKPALKAFGRSVSEVGNSLIAIATETEEKHRTFYNSHEDLARQRLYFRFNPPYLDAIALNEAEKRGDIRVRTEEYGNDPEVALRVRNFQEVAGSEPILPGTVPRMPTRVFYALTDQPNHMLKDKRSYWQRLTLVSYNMYFNMALDCQKRGTSATGKISFQNFLQMFNKSTPPKSKIIEIWARLLRDHLKADVAASKHPVSFVMAVLYMLHAECICHLRPPEDLDGATENRREALKRFDHWVSCQCKRNCGREWNFVNDLGLPRGGEPGKECDMEAYTKRNAKRNVFAKADETIFAIMRDTWKVPRERG